MFVQHTGLLIADYLLEVLDTEGNKGLIYFDKGILFDALYGKSQGAEAAKKMIALDRVQVCFLPLPEKKIKKNIEQNLMALIIKASD